MVLIVATDDPFPWQREDALQLRLRPRRIKRDNSRSEWRIEERPELRIISDELWERVQKTRGEVRKLVAPKHNLARGKDARLHSAHLLTGFSRCQICGGAMNTVSGKGSPRLGCRRSWSEGREACPNRLTLRMKVAEPMVLARLQSQLLQPKSLTYITSALGKAVSAALNKRPDAGEAIHMQLEQEKRKLQNLIAAIEGGSDAPSALLKAVAEREAAISVWRKSSNGPRTNRPARDCPTSILG